jgi:3-oxoacyl-[acyl-carrier protein] reductase
MSNGVTLSLAGKVALITGGSRGIGAATVRLFVAAGAKVVFNYQKARAEADRLVADLGAEHCHTVQADLSSPQSPETLTAETVRRFGRIDIAVLNHGIWPVEDIGVDEMSDEHWLRTINVNLNSVFGLLKHTVAQMKRQGNGGHIVIISSTSGQRGEAYHCDYSATKGAIISLVKSLAAELAGDRIYVNAVAPGWVRTDMVQPALADPSSGEEIRNTIPLGRVGEPDEIAGPVLFLCTKYASFITGEIFNVNGGAVLVG